MKISCIRAWRKHRETSSLVPVIVTPELKLFRIEEPQPYNTSSKSEAPSSIPKSPVIVQQPQPKLIKVAEDPLYVRETRSVVKNTPAYPVKVKVQSPSQALIRNNYCYICKTIKSNLQKHLLEAHCLFTKNLQNICSECGVKFNDENSFFRHFEHYHNETAERRPTMVKKRAANPLISNPIKFRKIQPKSEVKQEDAT